MPSIRTLQQLVLAGTFTLAASLASAGSSSPPSSYDDNDDTDKIVMIALGLAIASSIDCASNAPSIPGCDSGGSLRGSLGSN